MDLCDEGALALDGQRSKSPEGQAQDMTLVDLTMSPSTPVWEHHGSGTSCSRPKMNPRAWLGGNVDVSDSREGEDGFVYGVSEDGTTFTTEVPNVVWGLPKMTTGSKGPL